MSGVVRMVERRREKNEAMCLKCGRLAEREKIERESASHTVG